MGTESEKRTFWLRAIWISLAGVVLPPLIALAGTAIGMAGAFGELSRTGSGDPEVIARDISVSLLTTAGGLVVSLVAFLVLLVALIRFFQLPKPPPGIPPVDRS